MNDRIDTTTQTAVLVPESELQDWVRWIRDSEPEWLNLWLAIEALTMEARTFEAESARLQGEEAQPKFIDEHHREATYLLRHLLEHMRFVGAQAREMLRECPKAEIPVPPDDLPVSADDDEDSERCPQTMPPPGED